MEGQRLGGLFQLAPGTHGAPRGSAGTSASAAGSPRDTELCTGPNEVLGQVLNKAGASRGYVAWSPPWGGDLLAKLGRAPSNPVTSGCSSGPGAEWRGPEAAGQWLSPSRFVCVGHGAKTISTACPGASPRMAWDSPRKSSHCPFLPVPPAALTPSFWMGAHRAVMGIKSRRRAPGTRLCATRTGRQDSPGQEPWDSPSRGHAAVADPRPPGEHRLLGRAIQVRCGSSWSTVYGTSGGNTQEFILQPGEYITMISGSYKLYMHSLVIYTHVGRYGLFGKESDFNFMAYPDEEGQVLTGICGQHKLLGISGLCFNWGYPPTNITEVYASL
uniref:Zymogen granule protein 16B n=1 Tax=Canis lupus familiaris TaxID=9615 RepID=A0A8P0NKH8_CANLF